MVLVANELKSSIYLQTLAIYIYTWMYSIQSDAKLENVYIMMNKGKHKECRERVCKTMFLSFNILISHLTFLRKSPTMQHFFSLCTVIFTSYSLNASFRRAPGSIDPILRTAND